MWSQLITIDTRIIIGRPAFKASALIALPDWRLVADGDIVYVDLVDQTTPYVASSTRYRGGNFRLRYYDRISRGIREPSEDEKGIHCTIISQATHTAQPRLLAMAETGKIPRPYVVLLEKVLTVVLHSLPYQKFEHDSYTTMARDWLSKLRLLTRQYLMYRASTGHVRCYKVQVARAQKTVPVLNAVLMGTRSGGPIEARSDRKFFLMFLCFYAPHRHRGLRRSKKIFEPSTKQWRRLDRRAVKPATKSSRSHPTNSTS